MLAAHEIKSVAEAYKAWVENRQTMIDGALRARGSRPVRIQFYDEEPSPALDVEPLAAKILGYGSYRSAQPDERTVEVGRLDPPNIPGHPTTNVAAIANSDLFQELRPLMPIVTRDGAVPVRVAIDDADAQFALATLLELLYAEQVTPDVAEKPSLDLIATTIIEVACHGLGLRRPSPRELFVVGIATAISELDKALSDGLLHLRMKQPPKKRGSKQGPASSRRPTKKAPMSATSLGSQRESELSTAEERWKKRLGAARRHAKWLMSRQIEIV